MLSNFEDLLNRAVRLGRVRLSVAVAQDIDVLRAVKLAYDFELVEPLLVGDARLIKQYLADVGLPDSIEIVAEDDVQLAALKAVKLVSCGRADVLMKGLINSSDFLKAVLHKDYGLRTGALLSHLAVFEVPGQDRLLFHTDGGMNINPNLAEKIEIVKNALSALHTLGITKPNIAVLTANEQVNAKVLSTVHARELYKLAQAGYFGECTLEGPIALDVAASKQAAAHKGIKSEIAGCTDLFVLPNIEAGNMLGKALIYYADAKMAGIVLGAMHPIVLTSRADTPTGKLHSIALACLLSRRV